MSFTLWSGSVGPELLSSDRKFLYQSSCVSLQNKRPHSARFLPTRTTGLVSRGQTGSKVQDLAQVGTKVQHQADAEVELQELFP